MAEKNISVVIPTIAMRGLVLFPQMVLQFDVGREKSLKALDAAMEGDRKIFLVAQKNMEVDDPSQEDLYTVGVVATITQIIKTDDKIARVIVKGEYRAKSIAIIHEGYLKSVCFEFPLSNTEESNEEIQANVRVVKSLFEKYCLLSPKMPKELVLKTITSEDPAFISEFIAENLPLKMESKQRLLEESNIIKRLSLLATTLNEENEIASIESEIYEKVREKVDKNQRDYYLREQLKAIEEELEGEEAGEYSFEERIDALPIEDKYKDKLFKDVKRLDRLPSNSNEYGVITSYLETVLELPWYEATEDKIDIEKAEKQLNKDHFGLKDVKSRILETLAVRAFSPDVKGQILCLAGPPGVGKTSIASSIAKTMGRKFARIALGGVRDESDIRGHRKTYVGAMEGRIISAIETAGTSNPVILLDEIDKMGNDFRGDPSSAMLEVLDSEQNSTFTDHYIEIPFDLSNVFFIATANDISEIPTPLLDRMEVINLGSYTREEKFNIAKRHLIPKQLHKHGVLSKQIKFSQNAIYFIIDSYTREAGVRQLERLIASVIRKSIKDIVKDDKKVITVSPKLIETYLGPQKFKDDEIDKKDSVGVVNGLAWTSVGGELLKVEVAVLEGSGKIELTGSLGDVMKESASAAMTYVRSVYKKYSIDKDFYKKKDIHIHFPEGAVPKDGPSAGVAITTCIISALTNTPVRHDVAMTGEVTIRGKVLPIGGLKEKTMAAYRNKIKTVIIPKENEPDLYYVDDVVKENVEFVFASEVKTVIDTALKFDDIKIIKNSKKPFEGGEVLIVPKTEKETVSISQ